MPLANFCGVYIVYFHVGNDYMINVSFRFYKPSAKIEIDVVIILPGTSRKMFWGSFQILNVCRSMETTWRQICLSKELETINWFISMHSKWLHILLTTMILRCNWDYNVMVQMQRGATPLALLQRRKLEKKTSEYRIHSGTQQISVLGGIGVKSFPYSFLAWLFSL